MKSWFQPLLPADWGDPLKAEVLTDDETDREKKMRALFRRSDGTLKEANRTLGGRNVRVTFRNASRALLRDRWPRFSSAKQSPEAGNGMTP